MDPMDYVFHNHPRSSAVQYDPVHSVTGSWAPQPNPQASRPPTFQWPHPPRSPPSLHRIPGAMANSDPYQISPNGGLPPPFQGFYSAPMASDFTPPVPQAFHLPYSHMPIPRRVGIPPDVTGDDAFINQVPGGERPVSFHPDAGLGMVPASSSNYEPNSLPHPSLSLSNSTNGFSQHNNNPHFALPPPGPANVIHSTPPRRNHYSLSSPSPRFSREVQSPTRSAQSGSTRRPHTRARRIMPRYPPTGIDIDESDELSRQLLDDLRARELDGSLDQQALDDLLMRQIQLHRGSDIQPVASKMTLQSMQSVKIEDLAEEDRVCIICYNEFGTESPEGINEAPLRLPKCKHVFGDHCIKKWFESSDNCPYCRDKVHSEPKRYISSSRTFMNLVRMRTQVGLENEMLLRSTGQPTSRTGESGNRQNSTGGRRSPPDDAGEPQRRTRPRHGESDAPSGSPTSPTSPTSPAQSGLAPSGSSSLPSPSSIAGNSHATPAIPQRSTAPHPSSSTQRRLVTTGGASRSSRRTGTSSPPTSMSALAPSFHPQVPNLEQRHVSSGDSPFIASTTSWVLPNPLLSTSTLAQGRQRQPQQQDGTHTVGSQLRAIAAGSIDNIQTPRGQNNRTRPW